MVICFLFRILLARKQYSFCSRLPNGFFLFFFPLQQITLKFCQTSHRYFFLLFPSRTIIIRSQLLLFSEFCSYCDLNSQRESNTASAADNYTFFFSFFFALKQILCKSQQKKNWRIWWSYLVFFCWRESNTASAADF